MKTIAKTILAAFALALVAGTAPQVEAGEATVAAYDLKIGGMT